MSDHISTHKPWDLFIGGIIGVILTLVGVQYLSQIQEQSISEKSVTSTYLSPGWKSESSELKFSVTAVSPEFESIIQKNQVSEFNKVWENPDNLAINDSVKLNSFSD